MNPRLVAIAGPLEGAFYALPEEEVTIGSDPRATLPVDEPAIAPLHCAISAAGDCFELRALNGHAGVFINGLPVRRHVLSHGDEVRIGDTLFLFLVYEAETPPEVRLEREIERLKAENRRLLAQINIEHNMVGESAAMRAVFRFIGKVAPTESTVLIHGESGTGKELVARALHRNSRRASKPFVAINCAAIAETLLETELFGHEKGSFTGAVAQKRGKLEVAEGGTVFLDEVGELAASIQAKLLRVLQEHEFERVGGTRTIKSDIRVIAATNRDLPGMVRRGLFRQDLYYRLDVVSVTMPPLRERRQDIPMLAQYLAAKLARRSGREPAAISPEAQSLLARYDWPGNVRELENAVERAIVLGSSRVILPEDLPEVLLEADPAPGESSPRYHELVNAAKRRIVIEAIEQARGNCSEAARHLGLHPNNLHRLIRNLELRNRLPSPGIAGTK